MFPADPQSELSLDLVVQRHDCRVVLEIHEGWVSIQRKPGVAKTKKERHIISAPRRDHDIQIAGSVRDRLMEAPSILEAASTAR